MSDDLELDYRNALANDAVIAPLVTSVDGTVRIFPVVLKQETPFPAITYTRVSTVRDEKSGSYSHSAGASGYTGRGWARIQTTIWSDEFADLAVLAKAVRNVVHRTSFAGDPHPANSILLDSTTQEAERNLYRRIIDVRLWFTETP